MVWNMISSGTEIVIIPKRQELYVIDRSLRERLFTRPWEPLKKTRIYIDKKAVEDNKKVINLLGTLYMTKKVFNALKESPLVKPVTVSEFRTKGLL